MTQTRYPLRFVLSACVAIAALSCKDDEAGDGQAEGATDGATGADETGGDPDAAAIASLDACRGTADDEAILDALVIADEYAASLHEMIGCGTLNVALCRGVVEGLIEAIIAQSSDATPDGWEFVGDGVYRTSNETVQMDMSFYLAEDFVFAQAGDRVQDNLFLVDSYLVGAVASIDPMTLETSIAFEEPGPLVELLGFGENPPNPLPVGLNDVASLQDKLRALEFEGDVVVMDEQPQSTLAYDMHVPRAPAGALIDVVPGTGMGTNRAMSYDILSVDATRPDLSQMMAAVEFDVGYANHGTLEGSVDFTVGGGPVEFAANLQWDDTELPERSVSCP